MAFGRSAGGVTLALLLSACGGDPVSPTTACSMGDAGTPTAQVGLFQASRITERCVKLAGGGAHYYVMPQFAAQGDDPQKTAFTLKDFSGTTAAASLASPRLSLGLVPGAELPAESPQRTLDKTLRAIEGRLAPEIAREVREVGYRGYLARGARLAVETGAGQTPAATRDFRVLGDLNGTNFKTATADLKYTGTNIAIYVDRTAPANGFTTAQLNAFGKLFDETLFPLDVNAFGAPSDIDANGKVVVLLTPLVNALTSKADCTTKGYVTGYFYGVDLSQSQPTTKSNRGEVFYSIVPDPGGTVSCNHTVSSVNATVPGTFIHELQHMISYAQHVLMRQGNDEVAWLNEGLSHIAEELGSRYYEDRFPAPLGRTVATDLFPDSAKKFIVGNIRDAFRYLEDPTDHSVTTFDAFGSLEERGAAWLFLRWLGDQKGDAIFKSLVQTNLTGVQNIEGKAGESFPVLFGDFGVALVADSIPGIPRASVPQRNRFKTRNLRQLFSWARTAGEVSRVWPLTMKPLASGDFSSGSMVQGTMDFYDYTTPSGTPTVGLQFSRSNHAAFSSGLNAQVAIIRVP